MSCPTCACTMQFLGGIDLRRYWCPRCGTLKEESGGLSNRRESHAAPKLVERCREFEQRLVLVTAGDGRPWHALGIGEAIRRPEDRPT